MEQETKSTKVNNGSVGGVFTPQFKQTVKFYFNKLVELIKKALRVFIAFLKRKYEAEKGSKINFKLVFVLVLLGYYIMMNYNILIDLDTKLKKTVNVKSYEVLNYPNPFFGKSSVYVKVEEKIKEHEGKYNDADKILKYNIYSKYGSVFISLDRADPASEYTVSRLCDYLN